MVGCFCNAGACQEQLQWSGEDVQSNYKIGRSCWDDSVDIINGKPTGMRCCGGIQDSS